MGLAFYIIVIHFIADFIFQNEFMATNKSSSNEALLAHTIVYTIVWVIPAGFIFAQPCDASAIGYCINAVSVLAFLAITFIAHTVTDYITSRVTKKKFENKEYYALPPRMGAFAIIGLDQVLHYAQLFGTYYLLTK
jgi:hypothetical protein